MPQRRTKMVVTENHLKLLAAMEFDWDDGIEFGCVASDTKRPFGNGGVPDDIQRITGMELTWEQAGSLVAELAPIVNLAIKRLIEMDAPLGMELALPWRASTTPALS